MILIPKIRTWKLLSKEQRVLRRLKYYYQEAVCILHQKEKELLLKGEEIFSIELFETEKRKVLLKALVQKELEGSFLDILERKGLKL